MKLKKKLAIENYIKHLHEHGGYDEWDSEEWFICGFEAARKLAIEIAQDEDHDLLENLGEEEVKE